MVTRFPSKGELGQLTRQTIGVYTARVALRASVFLCAKRPLKDLWPEDTLRHSTALLGVWVFLRHGWSDAGTPNVKKNRDSLAARADYVFLLENPKDWGAIWAQVPLWEGFERSEVATLQQRYLQELRDLGLGFLQDDACYAWGLTGSEAPSQEYLQKLEQRLHHFEQLWTFSTATSLDAVGIQRILDEGLASLINAVRVVLVGPGGAGKTALNHLLHTGQPLSQSSPASLAIDYKPIADKQLKHLLSLAKEPTVDQLKLSTWDFAGQTLFYGLHQAFLHENCVYVLVVDNRHEQAPDAWLAQIDYVLKQKKGDRLTAPEIDNVLRRKDANNSRAPLVFIVTNEYEGLKTKQNEERLMREHPDLLSKKSFFYFSCLENPGQDYHRFIKGLLKACLDSKHGIFPETQQAIKAIEKQFKKGKLVLAYEEGLLPILETALADAGQATDVRDIDRLQETLEGLGVIVPNGESSIIDPSKVAFAAYRLLSSAALKKCFGLVDSLAQLSQVYKTAVPPRKGKHRIALDSLRLFLEEREVCITLKKKHVHLPRCTNRARTSRCSRCIQKARR